MDILHFVIGIGITLLSAWLLYTSFMAYRRQGNLRLLFITCGILLLFIFGITMIVNGAIGFPGEKTLINMLALYVLGVLAFMTLAIGKI